MLIVDSRNRVARRVMVLFTAVLVSLPTTAAAQDEPGQDPADAKEQDQFELLDETLDVIPDAWVGTGDAPTPLILWPEGRRAYQFATTDGQKPDVIVPIDLDTLEPITETGEDGEEQRVDTGPLDPPGFQKGGFRFRFQPEQVAMDHDRGVMFFPHHSRITGTDSEPTCRDALGFRDMCLGGIHAIDLADDAMAPVETVDENPIPFLPIGADRVIQSPVLRAMSFTSELGGERGKLHLLVEEHAHSAGTLDGLRFAPRDVRVPTFVFQVDVATGRHDWVEPAPGCTSYRGRGDDRNASTQTSHVVFADGGDDPAVYVGCYGPSQVGTAGRIGLASDGHPETSESFPGPADVVSIQADPAARRIWFKSLSGGDEAWWVYDGGVSTYLGVVGIGEKAATSGEGRTGAVDPATGRLYVIESLQWGDGGLYVADGRRVPIPQATIHRDLPMADIEHLTQRVDGEAGYITDEAGHRRGLFHSQFLNPMVVDAADGDRPRRLFVRPGASANSERWYVIADRRPVADAIVPTDDILGGTVEDPPETVDVDLDDEHTRTSFTGSARGYGLRTLLLGGIEALLPSNLANEYKEQGLFGDQPSRHFACGRRTREFAFGLSGSLDPAGQPDAKLEPGASSGSAVPRWVDDDTRRDQEQAVDGCAVQPLEGALEAQDIDSDTAQDLLTSLGVQAPDIPGSPDAPVTPVTTPDKTVGCSAPRFDESGGREPTSADETGDGTMFGQTATAEVRCEDDVATTGMSRSRFVSAGPVSVVESFSAYDVSRDTATGAMHATAHAYARGVAVAHEVTGPDGEVVGTSTIEIDMVETTAVAWATGRTSTEDAQGCDVEDRTRGAGTCIRTTISGARVVDGATGQVLFECERCQEEEEQGLMLTAMRQALGDSWTVQVREPDALLARGSQNGTVAAVQKREVDEFADVVMKGDLIKTLPGLEMVRYNDNADGRGRQVYLFAGVELGATFSRQCLGIVEGEACVAPPVPLAQVEVSLTDGLDGSPLAGGRFEMTQTSAVSGATPLDSPVSCTTNATGRCELVGLPAGSYTLRQTDAPGDYAPAEPLSLDLSPGSIFDVSVSNVREVGAVVAGLTDLDGVPLAGGMFELHADVDGDGTVGLDDPQVDVCSTGADGTCTMADLSLGDYVLSQAAAPDGYAAVDDQVPFVLDVPGQTATIGYTNAPAGSGASGSGSLGAVTELPPTQPVAVERPPGAEGPQVADPQASRAPLPQQLAETWQLLRRNPVQAAAFGLMLALAAAAVAGPMRRRLLLLTAG